jgi:aspartyl-tRNA(Asn)/glutamyl-tRNA(Gln) amidotransferase subunit B
MNLMSSGTITDTIGRVVLEEMFQKGERPGTIITEKGLRPIQDAHQLDGLLQEAMDQNPDAVIQIKAGETKPIDFLIGQVMRKTQGKADPKRIREMIQERLVG